MTGRDGIEAFLYLIRSLLHGDDRWRYIQQGFG
jgi:hypothetical protein